MVSGQGVPWFSEVGFHGTLISPEPFGPQQRLGPGSPGRFGGRFECIWKFVPK